MGLSARPRGERWLQPVAAGLAAAVILILSWGYTPYQDLYIAYSSQEDKDKLAVLHSLDEQLSEMELPVPSDASYLIFGTQDIVIGEWLNPVMQMKLGTKNVLSFKWPLEEVGEMALEQWMYSFTHLLVTEDTETTRFALKYFGLETKNAKGDYNINDLLY